MYRTGQLGACACPRAQLAVDVLAISDVQDENPVRSVIDVIKHPVVAATDSEGVGRGEFLATVRARVPRQGLDTPPDSRKHRTVLGEFL